MALKTLSNTQKRFGQYFKFSNDFLKLNWTKKR
jgi:hypothetical protein